MSRKKQVIFIMTDTQRTDMLGCYGNERMITPNLDRLAREGIRYDKAYTTSRYVSRPERQFLREATHIPARGGQIVWDCRTMCRISDRG